MDVFSPLPDRSEHRKLMDLLLYDTAMQLRSMDVRAVPFSNEELISGRSESPAEFLKESQSNLIPLASNATLASLNLTNYSAPLRDVFGQKRPFDRRVTASSALE
jgi:hypothetical protein